MVDITIEICMLLAEREHEHGGALRPFELALVLRRGRTAREARQRTGDLLVGGVAIIFIVLRGGH
jgi:hypothetical protein